MLKEKGLNIVFSFQTRPETVTYEVIKIYKEAGLIKPYIGIETIEDDEVSADKQTGECTYQNHIENVLGIFSSLGYEPDIGRENYMELKFGYITFHPRTTVKSFKNAVYFFKKHRLTPKRLVKKMNLIDGDMDVKQELLDKDFISDSTTEYCFADQKVDMLYKYMRQYTDVVFDVRDQIRSIEKHLFLIGVEKSNIEDLVKFRLLCDESVYDYGIELVYIIDEESTDVVATDNKLTTWSMNKIIQFKECVQSNNIFSLIERANNQYGVDKGMYDLYW